MLYKLHQSSQPWSGKMWKSSTSISISSFSGVHSPKKAMQLKTNLIKKHKNYNITHTVLFFNSPLNMLLSLMQEIFERFYSKDRWTIFSSW